MRTDLEAKELRELRDIAEELGIDFANNIGKAKLIDKIIADEDETNGANAPTETKEEPKKQTKAEMKRDMDKLIRVKVSTSNPMMQGRRGVSLQVGNSTKVVGKFIPFNTIWHVQEPVLQALRRRTWRETRFEERVTNGVRAMVPVTEIHPAYNIEVLKPLTKAELKKLAAEQAARGSIPQAK